MTVEITDEQKKEIDRKIFKKTKSLWDQKLTECEDAITISDLDKILKQYGL